MEDYDNGEKIEITGCTTIYDDGFVNSDDIIILDGEDDGEKRSCTLTSDEFIKFDSGSDFNQDDDAFEEDNLEENDEDDDVQIKNETMEFLMEQEKMLLNTPSFNTLQSDLRKLSEGRRVQAYSFQENELFSSEVLEMLLSSASNEITINLIKSKHLEDHPWTGYVTLDLNSHKEAKKVSDKLKKFKEDINITCDKSMSDKKVKTCREWIKEEKLEELDVSERVLLVSNPLSNMITDDVLSDLFPEALETYITHQNNNSLGYVVFENSEVAHAVAVEGNQQWRDLNSQGQHFYIYKYVKPHNIHRDLLMVHERYLILRYIDRLKRAIERNAINPKYKIPDFCSQRLERSLHVIEQDNKLRLSAGLTPPTTVDLLGVKKLKGSSWTNVLLSHKIIEKNNSANSFYDQKSCNLRSVDDRSQDVRNNGAVRSYNDKRHSNKYDIRTNKSTSNNKSLLGEPPNKITTIFPSQLFQHNLNIMGMIQNQLSINYGAAGNNFLWPQRKKKKVPTATLR